MELTDIMALVKAGYTKNEIMQMAQPAPTTADSEPVQMAMDIPAQVSEPAPAHVTEPVAVAKPVPQPEQIPAEPTMAEVMQSIAKLTSAIQANAISQSRIPEGLSNPPSAEDMLAEIIRPTYKERV